MSSSFKSQKTKYKSGKNLENMCGHLKSRHELKKRIQNKLNSIVPCRKVQINSLLEILLTNQLPACIFLYGHTATGKTLVLSKLGEELNYAYARVNCIECYTPKLLFEQILFKFFGPSEGKSNDLWPCRRCDYMIDFVNILKQEADSHVMKKPLILVLDNCERLRDMDPNLLAAFIRLQECTLLNICVILVSCVAWDKFYSRSCFEMPVNTFFPQYTRDELLTLLMLNRDPEVTPEFYESYVKLVLGVCHRYCRSLVELQHVADVNFEKYCSPLEGGKTEASNIKKLWQNIKPYLEASVNGLYLSDTNTLAMSLGLPYFTKFMLIAAYLASYNPTSSDKRLFVKHHGKERKSNRIKKQPQLSRQLKPPDSFSFDRLLAIFYAIIDNKVGLTTSLLAQVSTLVQLKLLTQDNDDCLSTTYRCVIGLDFVKAIASEHGKAPTCPFKHDSVGNLIVLVGQCKDGMEP
uniref:Origin recognition complex subunit 5 n=1 Tax=Timema bartmani TaxID=61472 RepID=A0A7R9ETE4_9NEOP|nr:unnamed protein product [Timema bartmani]